MQRIKSPNYNQELYSSTFTLSDMEIFVFPELLFAATLSAIMSEEIWKWKENPWFKDIEQQNQTKQIHRLKQYIMDNYSFNLDLETWGLTDKKTELKRFKDIINIEVFQKSNALFGYEGDRYYFSMDIRKHFGLDKYDSDVIPYWKTENIEAMNAFKYKKNHNIGSGECVSFSILYVAALFVVLKIPLEKILMIATPLHSQNYVAIDEGIITNNRRILSKNMWFNGTMLTEKARRAIENEHISYVSHISGYIHSVYPEATIDNASYLTLSKHLASYLHVVINSEIFINFLRSHTKYMKYFQFSYISEGQTMYIKAEVFFGYEHGSNYKISDKSRIKLFGEVDTEEFDISPYSDRYIINDLEAEFDETPFYCKDVESMSFWKTRLEKIDQLEQMMEDLSTFSCLKPKMPEPNTKTFIKENRITLHTSMNRAEIFEYLSSRRNDSLTADLAFYIGRYCIEKEWEYFLKAAIERNPVSIDSYKEITIDMCYQELLKMKNQSIYSNKQFAQPDEVVNFLRGDGIEKAFMFANIILGRDKDSTIEISCQNKAESIIKIKLLYKGNAYSFESTKKVTGIFILSYGVYSWRKS
jgi:hypothetical protein